MQLFLFNQLTYVIHPYYSVSLHVLITSSNMWLYVYFPLIWHLTYYICTVGVRSICVSYIVLCHLLAQIFFYCYLNKCTFSTCLYFFLYLVGNYWVSSACFDVFYFSSFLFVCMHLQGCEDVFPRPRDDEHGLYTYAIILFSCRDMFNGCLLSISLNWMATINCTSAVPFAVYMCMGEGRFSIHPIAHGCRLGLGLGRGHTLSCKKVEGNFWNWNVCRHILAQK